MRKLGLRVSMILVAVAFASFASRQSDADCTDPATCPADAYRALRDRARSERDASAREAIASQMSEIEQRIALVAVRGECEGAVPFTVLVDQKVVTANGAVPLTPGVHELVLRCPKGDAHKTVSVHARDRVELEFPMGTFDAPKPAGAAPSPRGCGCTVVGGGKSAPLNAPDS
jgi:hypothetical protein